ARAVWGGRLLRARYRRRPEADPVERVLRPAGLVLKAGTWYLVARPDEEGAEHRVYRVDRLVAAEPRERWSAPDRADETFDLAAFWEARAEGFARSLLRETLTVRLSPLGLERLPHLLEPVAAREALASAGPPDGDGRVTVRLPVESLEVGYEEILRLGPEAEVLEPPALRQRLAGAAARTAALYGPPQR
ncbi:WYL domain-containing protein, partial [Streptomyces sp. NRRL S-495]|uniref:WYL domain-containing protein n=1 Tax=Streptomyces sp. NRRL S-495 TaxID=1609133 RepID=UPI0005F93C19